MSIVHRKITLSRRQDGTELLRATLTRPEGDFPLIADLIARAEAWLERELLPAARRTYENDPDPGKRFHFRRYEYSLSLTLTPDAADMATLTIDATLARAKSAPISETHRTHRLRLSDSSLLPVS